MTFVYVTHDQEEALTMSDRIAVFNEGRIEQVGTPARVYEHPANEFVAGFVGISNMLERDGRRFACARRRSACADAEAGGRRRSAGSSRRRLRRRRSPATRRHRRGRHADRRAAEPRHLRRGGAAERGRQVASWRWRADDGRESIRRARSPARTADSNTRREHLAKLDWALVACAARWLSAPRAGARSGTSRATCRRRSARARGS